MPQRKNHKESLFQIVSDMLPPNNGIGVSEGMLHYEQALQSADLFIPKEAKRDLAYAEKRHQYALGMAALYMQTSSNHNR